VPFVLAQPLPEISGVTLEDARIGVAVRNGKVLASKRGELLFTHKGLSGPSALDVSGELTARTSGALRDVDPGTLEVSLDLLPEVGHEQLTAELQQGRGGRYVLTVLHDLGVTRSLAKALTLLVKIPDGRLVSELRREERTGLVKALKDLRLATTGTLGFDKAEVTAGGVALDEVNPTTLESRRVPGLHWIGEVLDVDGPVGGYNFQAAWSTGYAAGSIA
jgi:predicted Rossmann fold flavoprotein